jgi:hypothetical protein
MRAGKVDVWTKRTRRLVRHWVKGSVARASGIQPLHVLHIYKTGGTALKHALDQVPRTSTHAIFSHKHSISLNCIPRGHSVVFTVRDPVARFISGFYDRRREGRPRYSTPWSEAERRTFERFLTPNAIGEALAGSAPEVAEAKAALASLDRLAVPWSAWLGTPADLVARKSEILYVGRQETLEADFERLRKILSLPPEAALPKDDVDAHRARDVDRQLSETARAALAVAFAENYAWLALLEREGLLLPFPSRPATLRASVNNASDNGESPGAQPSPALFQPRP